MSRLPRLRSSSPDRANIGDAGPSLPARTTTNLKRKAILEEDEDNVSQPRKLAALGSTKPNRPLQPSRTVANSSSTTVTTRSAALPKPLTRPRAPTLTQSTRGTSAPPANSKPSRPPTSRSTGRVVSGSGPSRVAVGGRSDDKRFTDLQEQVTSIEAAR